MLWPMRGAQGETFGPAVLFCVAARVFDRDGVVLPRQQGEHVPASVVEAVHWRPADAEEADQPAAPGDRNAENGIPPRAPAGSPLAGRRSVESHRRAGEQDWPASPGPGPSRRRAPPRHTAHRLGAHDVAGPS